MNLSTEKKQTHGHGEQTCGFQGGVEGSEMDWEFGVNRCKLLLLEWISNEILLCSTGYYVLSHLMQHDNVKKRMYTCMCNWVSMLYSRKTIVLGKITIQKLKNKLKNK